VATGVKYQKAFIPFVPGAFANCPPGSGTMIQARVTGIGRSSIQLDRKVTLDARQVDSIPYSFIVSKYQY
jgi:hypothetical protein